MAKKVVAALRKTEGKKYTRVIKMVKSEVSGAYSFKEKIIEDSKVNDFFAKE